MAPYPAAGSVSEISARRVQEGGPCGRDSPRSPGAAAAAAAAQVWQEGQAAHFQDAFAARFVHGTRAGSSAPAPLRPQELGPFL